jgi:phage-related tail protein
MWIFTTLGLIVIIVVIGFLVGIVRALDAIDKELFSSTSSLGSANDDLAPLAHQIGSINAALTSIDTALKPLRGQVADASASLASIRDSAHSINISLKDTSASLTNISRSLADTSGILLHASRPAVMISTSLIDTSNVLLGVLGSATAIDGTLESLQSVDSRGVALIPQQLVSINGSLQGIQNDTSSINRQFQEANHHLTNICISPQLSLLPPFRCRK